MPSSDRIDELKKRYDENPRRFFASLANEYRKAGDLEQAITLCQTMYEISVPFTLPTAVEVVTAARPERPEVWYSRKPPTKATTMTIQIHFA